MSQTEPRKNPTKYLADMIEKGKSHIIEDHRTFFRSTEGDWCGCVLGMALVGHVGDVEEASALCRSPLPDGFMEFPDMVAKLLAIPKALTAIVNTKHCGLTPANSIIEKLRAGKFDSSV